MKRHVSPFPLLAIALALVACGGQSAPAPGVGPVVQLPSGGNVLVLGSALRSVQLSVTQPGYHGTYSAVSSNTSVATVTPATLASSSTSRVVQADDGNASFTVVAVGDGSATITVADGIGRSTAFSVTVKGMPPSPAPSAVSSSAPLPAPSGTATAAASSPPRPESPSPSASPSPAASFAPLTVAPASLAFSGTGQTLTVAVASTTSTTLSTAGCDGIAALSPIASGAFTVTSIASGSCTILITDTSGNKATIAVGVTTLTVPIQ